MNSAKRPGRSGGKASVVAARTGAFKNRGPVRTAEELREDAEWAIAESPVEWATPEPAAEEADPQSVLTARSEGRG